MTPPDLAALEAAAQFLDRIARSAQDAAAKLTGHALDPEPTRRIAAIDAAILGTHATAIRAAVEWIKWQQLEPNDLPYMLSQEVRTAIAQAAERMRERAALVLDALVREHETTTWRECAGGMEEVVDREDRIAAETLREGAAAIRALPLDDPPPSTEDKPDAR